MYADDLGHSSDVNQLQSSIDIMMFFEEKSRLVIITRTLMLSQFQVAEDGKITRIQQVKLSVAGDVVDRGLRSVVWCAPGILAIATHEKLVRLLDLATDESYNLSLTELGALLEKGDRVISAAFSSTDRYLAVGTQLGFIIIWKYNGPIRDIAGSKGSNVPIPSTSPDDWEVVPSLLIYSLLLIFNVVLLFCSCSIRPNVKVPSYNSAGFVAVVFWELLLRNRW